MSETWGEKVQLKRIKLGNVFSKRFVFVRVTTDQRYYVSTEAVVRRCSGKNAFLKISQSFEESTCAGVRF